MMRQQKSKDSGTPPYPAWKACCGTPCRHSPLVVGVVGALGFVMQIQAHVRRLARHGKCMFTRHGHGTRTAEAGEVRRTWCFLLSSFRFASLPSWRRFASFLPSFASLRFASLRFASLRFASLRFASLRFLPASLSFPFLSFPFLSYPLLSFPPSLPPSEEQ